MKVGIHLERYNQVSSFIQVYFDVLKFNGIEALPMYAGAPDFIEKLKEIDAFVYRWYHYDYDRQIAQTIIPVIEEELRIPCFPNLRTCWHFDDKIKQHYLSVVHGLPLTECHIFWDRKEAVQWISTTAFPLVFKLKGGAGSQNVLLVRNKRQAIRIVEKMFGSGLRKINGLNIGSTTLADFQIMKQLKSRYWKLKMRILGRPVEDTYTPHKNYVIFQKFLPGNEFDTRVTVIGNRAFAFRRFNRKHDFRSSGSGLIDHDPSKIDLNHIKTALEVSQKMKFQCMAYDFLYNESGGSEFCEMSYTFVDKAVYKCAGYWDQHLNWHEGHYWPQYFQLQDLLSLPDLKQPEL